MYISIFSPLLIEFYNNLYWSPEAEAEASEIFPGPQLGGCEIIVLFRFRRAKGKDAKCQIFYTEQIFQTKFYLVWRQGFIPVDQIYPNQYLILQNCIFFQTFYPTLPIFLHGYIRHICDILQLWQNSFNLDKSLSLIMKIVLCSSQPDQRCLNFQLCLKEFAN